MAVFWLLLRGLHSFLCCAVVILIVVLTENETTLHYNYITYIRVTVYTRVLADNSWLNFKDEALGAGLYVAHATQPYINSQSQHGMDH